MEHNILVKSKTKEKFIVLSSVSIKVNDCIWFAGSFHRVIKVNHKRFRRTDGDQSKYVMLVGLKIDEFEEWIWVPEGWKIEAKC